MASDRGTALSVHLRPALLALLAALTAGCLGPPPLYDWGIYEEVLWEGYRPESGGGDPASQLARLEEDVERIVASGKRVPPGVHAHIGFLRFATGDPAAAREHFLKERELFPESAVFMDGVLARLEGPRELPAPPLGPSLTPATEPDDAADPSTPTSSAAETGDSTVTETEVQEANP